MCSQMRRRLARDSDEKYRVCDQCDTELDNFKLIKMQNIHLENIMMKKLQFNARIEQIKNEKVLTVGELEERKKQVEKEITEAYEER